MVKNKIFILSLFVVVLVHTVSIAQKPYFKNYTENDGLASSTVYFICQDSGGFMWFATDAGVSRYNGYFFENYTTKNGLGDNEIFKIFEDSKKRIWFLSFNGKISYWYKGKFYNSANASFLKPMDSNTYFSNIIEDKKGNIWLGTEKSGLLKLNPANRVRRFFPVKDTGIRYLYETTKGVVLSITFNGLSDVLKDSLICGKDLIRPFSMSHIRYQYIGGDNLLFVSKDNKLYVFNNNTFNIQKIPSRDTIHQVINICNVRKDSKWICTRNGAYELSNYKTQNYLQGKSVSYVLKDHEGNLWFSTLDNGIYFTPASGILNYTVNDGLPINECYTLKVDSKNNLWVGQEKGWLTKIGESGISTYNFSKTLVQARGRITSICETKKALWITADFGLAKLENDKIQLGYGPSGEKCIIQLRDSMFYGSPSSLLVSSENSLNNFIKKHPYDKFYDPSNYQEIIDYSSKHIIMHGRVAKLFKDSRDIIWIGTNNGLRIYDPNYMIDFSRINPALKCRISGIVESKDKTIWVTTYENGVFSIKGKEVKQFKEKDGLLSDICNSIYVDDDNTIWIATNKGINKMWYKNGVQKIDYFDFDNGLISNQINDICVRDEKVWVATPKGLSCFDRNLVSKSSPPLIHITNFYVLGANKRYKEKKDYVLKYYENNIKIDYVGISYRHFNHPLLYRYKLDQKDTTWYYTNNTSLELPLLNPGNYEFVVEARSNEGVWSSKSSSVSFTIEKPFWQTFWFYFALVGLMICFVWLTFSLRYERLKKEEVLSRAVTESKLKALRAQMDPHFIFNSLMALQNLVSKNKSEEAESYIFSFAKLMRLILDNSRSEYIPLSDEIETLENYLKLQQLRRINIFEYKIYVDPSIDRDNVSIPPMLAQPFIENSIEHGIFNKTEKGIIDLKFTMDDGSIVLEVEDNGIGLQTSIKMKEKFKKTHKSLATTIVKERLELLNRKKEEKISLSMMDIKDDKDLVIGTKVTIRIPFRNNF